MTKLVVALSLALAAASFAGAADIALKDGRVLRDAVMVRHDAATVTFRHAAGFTQIEKSKLPEALAAEYPLDVAEAKLEAERQQQEVLARRAEAERLLALRLQLTAATPKPAEAPAHEDPKESAPSPRSTASWADTYNEESWRLMRIRARQDERDRDYRDYGRDRDGRGDDRNRSRDRNQDCRPPEPRSTRSTPITPDVHMTPDFTTVRFAPPPSTEVPPDATTPQWEQPARRF